MKQWVKIGLVWGTIMFLLMTFVFPYFREEEISLSKVVFSIILWSVMGLLFGYALRNRFNKLKKN
jgi:hypothetical protein